MTRPLNWPLIISPRLRAVKRRQTMPAQEGKPRIMPWEVSTSSISIRTINMVSTTTITILMSEKRYVNRCTPARGLLPITSRRASTDLQQPGRSPKWNSRSSRAPLIIMLVLVPIPSLQHHHQHPPPSIILFRRRAITLQYHRHQ